MILVSLTPPSSKVAVQLGLLDDAVRLYHECGRYDLLNRLYQVRGGEIYSCALVVCRPTKWGCFLFSIGSEMAEKMKNSHAQTVILGFVGLPDLLRQLRMAAGMGFNCSSCRSCWLFSINSNI